MVFKMPLPELFLEIAQYLVEIELVNEALLLLAQLELFHFFQPLEYLLEHLVGGFDVLEGVEEREIVPVEEDFVFDQDGTRDVVKARQAAVVEVLRECVMQRDPLVERNRHAVRLEVEEKN